MKKYLGVKIIEAEPAWFGSIYKEDENGASCSGPIIIVKSTYLHDNISIEWKDGYKVVYEDGYVSWSPKDVFEKAYRQIDNLTFGLAVEALKMGKKVARAGWNGKGMWLKHINYQPCNQAGHNDYGDEILIYDELPSEMELLPWIGMKTADDKFVPWLASQTDMLAEDWQIVE